MLSALHPTLEKNLNTWREIKLSRRGHGRAIYSRCVRVLAWATVHATETITSWRQCSPDIFDAFLNHRLQTPIPGRSRPPKNGTLARDLAAVREWLEWNEERELAGPVRSRYLVGRVSGKRDIDKFTLSEQQSDWLLQRARWVQRGQKTLRYTEPCTGKRKAAWCVHWPPGAFHLFCRLGLELGLRPRELFWLAWEDFERVDTSTVLTVSDHEEDGQVLNEVKSDASRRRLLVPPLLAETLQEYRDQQQDHGELYRFVFAVHDKRGWRKPEISFIFRALREELGEPRLVCNTLRKTCGQRLRRQGLDYFAIAQFLGHSATTCMRYYVSDCREEEAFDPATCKPVRLRRVE